MALEAKRVNNKTQGKSFLFLFLSKMEFRTYFVNFHTFSYKFKVQRTPTEFGLPVVSSVFFAKYHRHVLKNTKFVLMIIVCYRLLSIVVDFFHR